LGEIGVRGGLEGVFGEINAVQNVNISYVPLVRLTDKADRPRAASRNPYYVAQRMIMLGRTDVLISQFASQLQGIEERTSPE
jgi:hypothetical protein